MSPLMLVPAWHPLARGLADKMAEFEMTPRAAFYDFSRRCAFVTPTDDWCEVVRAVLDADGQIIGILGANIDRDVRGATNLRAACFVEHHPAFAVALRRFLLNLIAEFEVVRFSAIVGGPNVEMYRRAIGPLGGRVVGVFERYARGIGGHLIDFEWYEILGQGARGPLKGPSDAE